MLHAWQGLGYYGRGRATCTGARAPSPPGPTAALPETEQELRQLPGVGDYTAAAVAAIAFDRPAAGDGRQWSSGWWRACFAVEDPLPGAKPALRALTATGWLPQDRPGDHTQAMSGSGGHDLHAEESEMILWPLAGPCAGRAAGMAEDLPVKAKKKAKPTRRAVAFWVTDPVGRRAAAPAGGKRAFLGGLMEVPSSPWTEDGAPIPGDAAARAAAPVARRTGGCFRDGCGTPSPISTWT